MLNALVNTIHFHTTAFCEAAAFSLAIRSAFMVASCTGFKVFSSEIPLQEYKNTVTEMFFLQRRMFRIVGNKMDPLTILIIITRNSFHYICPRVR